MIADEIIEQIRDQADLIGMIGESVDLRRTGTDYRGPCPFHGGTHRNFAVIPKKGMFYCYVCHESGDIFTWFMKRHGLDYPSAVREVGRRVGVTVPETTQREAPDHREPLFAASQVAQDFFARSLRESPEGEEARRYLADRELPPDTAFELGLGYAPRGNAFVDAMQTLGVDEQALLGAGLIARRDDGSLRPRFRDRLIFPIADLRGRIVAFGGRLLGRGEPKYLNSPETEIFHKGRILYHLHAAKHAIRQAERVVLVEGYFDVVRLGMIGIDYVVAPMGTGLTQEQATLLARFTSEVVLLYDNDGPGLRATFRAGDELLRHRLQVRVASLPPKEDPDTHARAHGADGIKTLLADAIDVFELKMLLLERKGWFERLDQRREAIDRLLPTVRATVDPIARDLYLAKLAERVGVTRVTLLDEFERGRTPASRATAAPIDRGHSTPPRGGTPTRSGRKPAPGTRPQRRLLRVFLADPHWLERAREEVVPEMFEVPALREIYQALRTHASPDEAVETLSPRGQDVLQRLRASAAEWTGLDWDAEYDDALSQLRDEANIRAYQATTDPITKRALWKAMGPTARKRCIYRRPTRSPGSSSST